MPSGTATLSRTSWAGFGMYQDREAGNPGMERYSTRGKRLIMLLSDSDVLCYRSDEWVDNE